MGSGWLVSLSNDGEWFTDGLMYLPYDELCYDCAVSDDVRDMMAKPGDVMLAPVVCTRKVYIKLSVTLLNRLAQDVSDYI